MTAYKPLGSLNPLAILLMIVIVWLQHASSDRLSGIAYSFEAQKQWRMKGILSAETHRPRVI